MKQFTSILFGLVLGLNLHAYGQNVTQINTQLENARETCKDLSGPAYTKCVSCALNPQNADCPKSRSEINSEASQAKQECSTALEKYDKARKQNPCPTASNSKECYAKIESCRSSTGIVGVDGLATGNENIDGLANSVLEMISASKAAKQNSATDVNVNRSCYSAIQSREKDVAEKRKTRTDQIVKDIEAADKERREANEKLSKETNETKIDQQKLQAETAKTLQKLDVEKREKLTKMNEDLQKAGTDIRKQTTEILRIKQTMEKLKFENQKTMVAYTEEKINSQCKGALDTAKACMVKASKGVKFAEKDTCSNFAFSGNGTKGTGELRKKLKQVKEACFEQSGQTVTTLKYEYADKVRSFEMDIKEKQEQIADANKALEAKKVENEAINKETEAQKSQEQKNLEEQMANFAEKLTNLKKSTDAALLSSETKINRLNLELKDLKAGAMASEVSDPGSQSIYDNIANDASMALDDLSSATSLAFGACCNKGVSKAGTNAPCGRLNQDNKDAEKRSTVRVRAGSKSTR